MLIIRQMQVTDLNRVLEIFGEGLETKIATFETVIPSRNAWHQSHHPRLSFVAVIEKQVEGWIALSQVSKREVYRGVGEISVYISDSARGQGLGTVLMEKMIQESEKVGYWTLQSSIFERNQSSIALHSKVGFQVVGIREKIAQRDGEWQNTAIMERRRKIIF